MTWSFEGKTFTPEQAVGYHSFVYIITNTQDGRIYVGKKNFNTIRRTKKKGRKNRVTVTKPSDWENYWSSSEELVADVEKLGKSAFKREIIRLCRSKSESNYYECKFQIGMDLMIRQERTYNRWILCRLRPFRVLAGNPLPASHASSS
jgi:Putative endonuclease segE, GIY-YIG domain